jgi:plastocyanin
MKSMKWFGLLSLVLVLLLAGCSKKEETPTTEEQKPAVATPIDPATVASVSGTVKLDGAAPKMTKIDMSQDPACGNKDATTETVVANNGSLQNVFVYVKEGLGDRTFTAPAEAAVIDQKGCQYHPHVLGVMTGQEIKIQNSDKTTHNIHPSPASNKEWNESQPPGAAPLDKNFARQEVLLPVKCNQHPWMKMYIGVVKSPFFAVTDKDGHYEIKGLPPGDYTIAFVQEKYGETTQKVHLDAKQNKTDANATISASGGAPSGVQ